MMQKFVPDKYYKSIYDINYNGLKQSGIKCLIYDLSNTIAPDSLKEPTEKIKDLFEDLKSMDFKIIIMSNKSKKSVAPFKEQLCVDSSYLSHKPFKKKYKKIMRLYGLTNKDIACIGDQLFFDILGANRMKFVSILVNPISTDEFVTAKLSRRIENVVIRHLTKKDWLKKGRYYE